MVWLSGIMDFEMAEQLLQQIVQLNVSDSSIWPLQPGKGRASLMWR
jgi:hypothetical protein